MTRRGVWLAVSVVVLAAAVTVFVFVRPSGGGDCRQFADKVCAIVPASCGDAKFVIEAHAVSADRCREGKHLLEGIEAQPERMRPALASAAFAEAIGAETVFSATHDAMMLLMDIDFTVDQGKSPDDLIKRLHGLGPPACSVLIARLGSLGSKDPKRRDLAHQVLVDLRGQDLGADGAAWQGWCREVFRASLKPK
jgi:hypothetical protein